MLVMPFLRAAALRFVMRHPQVMQTYLLNLPSSSFVQTLGALSGTPGAAGAPGMVSRLTLLADLCAEPAEFPRSGCALCAAEPARFPWSGGGRASRHASDITPARVGRGAYE